jgi:hypothetical protein
VPTIDDAPLALLTVSGGAAGALRRRHPERARGGGVRQPASVGERRVVVVRVRPQPQDRGGGPGPAPVLLAPGQRPARRRLRLVPSALPPRRTPAAHRGALPVPGPRLARRGGEAPAGDGAEHAAVPPGAAHAGQVRRRALLAVAQQPLPRVHVQHAVVGGQGAVAERAEAADAGARRGAEAGAAQRGGGRGVRAGQPHRRGRPPGVVHRPRAGGRALQLQGGRRRAHGPYAGGGRRRRGERPDGVPSEEVVI